MRILTLILSLLLALPSGAVRVTLTAEQSDQLSGGALNALDALLADTALVIAPQGYDLLCGETPLLQARVDAAGGLVACGDQAAVWTVQADGGTDVWQAARALGALLLPWEKETRQSVDLQEAGTAHSQLVYALTGEEWAQVWPQTVAILTACAPEAAALAAAQIVGKGTLKRYFDRDGNEMGLYFYASELWLNGESREVRLEYGVRAGQGLYAAFRCPNKRETRNVRLALHAKKTAGGWSLSGSLRQVWDGDSEVLSVDGRTDGTLKLSQSSQRGRQSMQRTLTLEMRDGAAGYRCQADKQLVLAGTARWEQAALAPMHAIAPDGTIDQVAASLAGRLLAGLRAASPDHWQELVHALAAQRLIDAQKDTPKEAD